MPTKEQKSLQEAHPNTWIAIDEGDTLTGDIVEVIRAWSDARNNGPTGDGWYPLLKVRTSDGVVLDFHAFSAVTYREVMEKQPIPGERIIVTYQGVSGKAKSNQNPPKLYNVSLPNRDPREAARNIYARMGDGYLNPGLRTPADVGAQPNPNTPVDDYDPALFEG